MGVVTVSGCELELASCISFLKRKKERKSKCFYSSYVAQLWQSKKHMCVTHVAKSTKWRGNTRPATSGYRRTPLAHVWRTGVTPVFMTVLTRSQSRAANTVMRRTFGRWLTAARTARRVATGATAAGAAVEVGYQVGKWAYNKYNKGKQADKEVTKNVDRIVNPRATLYKRRRVTKYGKRKMRRRMKLRRRLRKLLSRRFKHFIITVNDPTSGYFRQDQPTVGSVTGVNQYWMIQGGAGPYPKNFPLGINFGYNAGKDGFRYNGIQLFNDFIKERQPMIEIKNDDNTILRMANQYQNEQLVTFCKEYREIDFMYTANTGDLGYLNVDIYEVVAKQDMAGQDDATGMLYQLALQQQLVMTKLGANLTGGTNNSNLTPFNTVGDYYSRKGQTPWDLPVFNKYFKIIKKTRFCLQSDVAQTYYLKGGWCKHSVEETPILKYKTRMLMVCLGPNTASYNGTNTDNFTITITNRHKYRFLNRMPEWKNGAVQATYVTA